MTMVLAGNPSLALPQNKSAAILTRVENTTSYSRASSLDTEIPRRANAGYRPRPSKKAVCLALIIEAGLVALAMLLLNNTATIKQSLFKPVAISILTEKNFLPPLEKSIPLPLSKNKLTLAESRPLPMSIETIVSTPAPLAPQNAAITEPASSPPPQNPSIDTSLDYATKVRAAVQAAVYYPPAAAALRFSGRVRVEFHLRDKLPSLAHVIIPSGIGMIDHAALESVQNAHYPDPPQDLRENDHLYQVWVEFTH